MVVVVDLLHCATYLPSLQSSQAEWRAWLLSWWWLWLQWWWWLLLGENNLSPMDPLGAEDGEAWREDHQEDHHDAGLHHHHHIHHDAGLHNHHHIHDLQIIISRWYDCHIVMKWWYQNIWHNLLIQSRYWNISPRLNFFNISNVSTSNISPNDKKFSSDNVFIVMAMMIVMIIWWQSWRFMMMILTFGIFRTRWRSWT